MLDELLKNRLGIKIENICEVEEEMLNFFNAKLMSNVNNWNLIIKVNRKGVAVFDSLKINFKEFQLIDQIKNFEIDSKNKNFFENKNILLFDDSIGAGKQIENEIKKLNKFNVEQFSIAAILSRQDTIEKLQKKYPKIYFLLAKSFNEEEYYSYFHKYMIGFFDYINKPLNSDLPISQLEIPFKLSKDEIKSLFNDESYLIEEADNFFNYRDRFQFVIDFSKKTKYNNIFKNVGCSIDNLKIRLFVHISDFETIIFIEYIPIIIGNMDKCKGNFKWCFRKQLNNKSKNFIKNRTDILCLTCVSRKLFTSIHSDFENMLDKRLSSQGIIYNLKIYKNAPILV